MLSAKDIVAVKTAEELSKILDMCLQLVLDAMKQGDSNHVFKLLDPLVSDNQCQIHSLLILDVLNKHYDISTSSYNIKELGEEDKKILSRAVLLTLLKVKHSDTFGLGLRNISSNDFCGLVTSKCRESEFIDEIKKEFNSYSVKYMRDATTGKIKDVFTKGGAVTSKGVELKLLPCYGSFCVLIDKIQKTKYPIILSFVDIRVKKSADSEVVYTLTDKYVLFYEFREDKFYYKENPDNSEKKRPAIVFFGYNLINLDVSVSKYLESIAKSPKNFLKKVDPRHILLLSAAGHSQLCKGAMLSAKEEKGDPEEYVRKLLEEKEDTEEYARELLKEKFSLTDRFTQYFKAAEGYGSKDACYITKEGNSITRTANIGIVFCRIISEKALQHYRASVTLFWRSRYMAIRIRYYDLLSVLVLYSAKRYGGVFDIPTYYRFTRTSTDAFRSLFCYLCTRFKLY
ncbi:uncharacterized protein [Euwallacea similis]|uniref:uncharacterized protein isoform X2 n=1 Tax=Euwallacea similis TaxID=1736056 RepID=UPI00344E97C8